MCYNFFLYICWILMEYFIQTRLPSLHLDKLYLQQVVQTCPTTLIDYKKFSFLATTEDRTDKRTKDRQKDGFQEVRYWASGEVIWFQPILNLYVFVSKYIAFLKLKKNCTNFSWPEQVISTFFITRDSSKQKIQYLECNHYKIHLNVSLQTQDQGHEIIFS